MGSTLQIIGTPIPSIELLSTAGVVVDLADEALGDFVLFLYPRTSSPDALDADEWALIPGAKGCTAESCQFRDLSAEFQAVGFSILGLSSQSNEDQREAAARLHLPYSLLSDPGMMLARSLRLPTFRYGGGDLYRRSTLVVRKGIIVAAQLEIVDAARHPQELLSSLTSLAT